MRINFNLPAQTAYNGAAGVSKALTKTINRLSTGLRINSAADDAAGLAIAEKLRAQVNGTAQALTNTQNGISMVQTAEGALSDTHAILQRMRALAVEAANDTLTSQDRSYIQLEIDQLREQVDEIARNTQFNGKKLLNGSAAGIWSSTDLNTKATIRGSLLADGAESFEGNYKIDVTTKAGAGQVQKTSILKIKHEDTITNVFTDADQGARSVEISGVPAADYTVAMTMGVGGDVTEVYTSQLEGVVTEANTSGANETMTLTFRGASGRTAAFSFALDSTNSTTEAELAQTIVNQVNGRTITVNGKSVELTASIDANDPAKYVIHAKSEEHITGMASSCAVSSPTSVSARNELDRDSDPWHVIQIPQSIPSGASAIIRVTVNGNTQAVSVGQNTSATAIAAAVRDRLVSMGLSSATVKGSDVWAAELSGSLSFNMSVEYNGTTRWQTPNLTTNYEYKNYRINATGTVSGTTNTAETYTLTFNDQRGKTSTATATVAAGSSRGAIVSAIRDAVSSQIGGSFTTSDSTTLNFTFEETGTGFTIKSTNRETDVWSSQILVSLNKSAGTAKGATTVSENTSALQTTTLTTAGGQAELTGIYNIDENLLSASITGTTGNAVNNASILFEVTGVAYDDNGAGTVSLKAASNVLTVDGQTAEYAAGKIVFSTSKPTINLGSLLGEDDDHLSLTLDMSDLSKYELGQKFVYSITGNGEPGKVADTSLFVTGNQDQDWPENWGDTVTYQNRAVKYNVKAGAVANSTLHLRNFYLDSESGEVYAGSIRLGVDGSFAAPATYFTNPTPMATFTANYVGKIATGDTRLRDLDAFWDSNGVFMLEEPQTLTLSQGDGSRAVVTLYSTDTINDLQMKLNDAIAYGLGQHKYTGGGDANKFVSFVEKGEEDPNGLETVPGTFVLRSLVAGAAGELSLSSPRGELIDALGLNVIQESAENTYAASVYDAHTGATIASDVKLAGNKLVGIVHKNVDVEFDAMPNVTAAWSEAQKTFLLSSSSEPYTTTLHLVDNATVLQSGANQGEITTLDLGDMSSASLGIGEVNVLTREGAARSISVLDGAIRKVSAARAKLGATQNSLEQATENLMGTNANLTEAESRIRDTNMAAEALQLVKLQMLSQSSNLMLSQANQLPQEVLSLIQ